MKRRFLLLLTLLPTTVHAQNLLSNSGFENPVLASGGTQRVFTGGSIGAWTVVGPESALIETSYAEPVNSISAFVAQEGQNALDLTGAGNVGLAAGVTQSVPTVIGQTYLISFYVGRADGNSFYATPATVDLRIDGGARTSFTNSGATLGTVNWQFFSESFVATNASTEIAFLNGTSDNNYVGLDNVSLTAVTAAPEPSSLGLMAFVALGWVKRRR